MTKGPMSGVLRALTRAGVAIALTTALTISWTFSFYSAADSVHDGAFAAEIWLTLL